MATDPELDPRLADAIAQLRDAPPVADLWPGIARDLRPRQPRGTMLIRWPTALAAGLAIAIAAATGTTIALHHAAVADSSASPAESTAPPPSATEIIPATLAPGDAALARAIDDLERAVRGNLDHLDPAARISVTQSLAALDAAIAQATARQNAAPDDPHASSYLTSALRKKLQLLRTVSQLTQQS